MAVTLLGLRDENGLVLDPELATGVGALGFWRALPQVWPKTRPQRCWAHKTANILNALPKSVHGKARQDLHALCEAENRKAAEDAFDRFLAKYDKATACLSKDRQGQITLRKIDGWQSLAQPPAQLDLAA